MENTDVENSDNTLHLQWLDLRALFDQLEADVVKNQKGVVAAGVRVRRGLRAMRKQVIAMIRETSRLDNLKKAERVAKKKASAAAA